LIVCPLLVREGLACRAGASTRGGVGSGMSELGLFVRGDF
jgi:hypothetical protein